MSLLESVVNESYGPEFGGVGYADGEGLSAAVESEINDRVTDEPETMFAYTSECMMGMLALEAAEAKMDGLCAVKFAAARANGDEALMEETVATMEGFVGDVWETLKEWIIKAYTAIKNFIIKAWNKMKGAAGVVKAFFTKYGTVLREKRVPGLMVKWCNIQMLAATQVYNTFLRHIEAIRQRVKPIILHVLAIGPGGYADIHRSQNQAGFSQNELNQAMAAIPSPHDINVSLARNIYPAGETSHDVPFEAIRNAAIEAADIGSYKKYVDNFLSLGDKSRAESLKSIQEIKQNHAKTKEMARNAGVSAAHSAVRRCLNAQIELHRMCTSAMYRAAKRMQSQSVSACRKAIMYHATKGEGATSTSESYVPTGVDAYMTELGF
jgi:hypothetical protein